MSADQARAALLGFGNALATVGKGKTDLDGVIVALSQIASKSKVSAEEINQIAERVPQIRQIMKGAFGTADTEALQKMGVAPSEFISKIVTELGKLPKVAGGSKNAFENMSDSLKIGMAAIGGALNRTLVPIMDKVSEKIQKLADSGQMDRIVSGFISLFDLNGDALASTLDGMASVLEGMPSAISSFKDSLVSAIDAILPTLTVLASVWAGLMLAGPIVQFAGLVVTAWTAITAAISGAGVAAAIFDALTGNIAAIAAAALVAAGAYVTITTAINAVRNSVSDFQAGLPITGFGRTKPTEGAKGKGPEPKHEDQKARPDYQKQIADHTARLVSLQERQVSIQRMILGGGDIMSRTLSNADLAALGRSGSRARHSRLALALGDMIQMEAADMLRRQGRIRK
jgi:tape measure domain-containing protein